MTANRRYVLVTPTKNEQDLIAHTITSVLSQTLLPTKWVIVDDGSTDQTREIVQRVAARHSWIDLLSLPPREKRSFAAVVQATQAGVQALTEVDYTYLGLLDSDVRFEKDYFERLIERFESSPRLGLAGGVAIDVGQPRHKVPQNKQDIPGAVQFYCRTCFEALGGLIAVPEGGWDGLACAQARMAGFETRLFTDLVVDHLKPRNISEGGLLRRHWQMGLRDYAVGYHPIFELLKCLARLPNSPFVVGSAAWWAGYCCAGLLRRRREVPRDLIAFLRSEQMSRVWGALCHRKRNTDSSDRNQGSLLGRSVPGR